MARKIQWLKIFILAFGNATLVALITVEGKLWEYIGGVAILFYAIMIWASGREDGEIPADCKIPN